MEGLSLERTEIIIAEYTAIRGEITALTQSEDTFISTFITFMAAFVGAAFLLSDKNDQLVRISQIFMIWFCPLVIMFFGCMWMNIFYKRIRFVAYLYLLEREINEEIINNGAGFRLEHWLVQLDSKRSFFTRTSRFWAYATFGAWLVMPCLMYILSSAIFPDLNILSYLIHHYVLTIIQAFVAIIYYYIMCYCCYDLVRLKSPKFLNSIGHFYPTKKNKKIKRGA